MNTRQHRGFNVIELMFAITVLGVLLAMGVPSFLEMIRNNRVVANTNEVVVALSMARSEALRRGIPISVCAATTPSSSTCVAATAGNWANGWIVFTDANGTAGAISAGDEVLQRFDSVTGGVLLTTNNRGFVRFAATGLPASGAVETTFSVKHSECSGSNRRIVRITVTGRLNTNKVACS
jgi:type IV fimbrial biogenesis protein FimT